MTTPTRQDIENGLVAEGPTLDYKSELDLDKSKIGFVDDVVAFLNAQGGRIIFGVAEKKGVWIHWRALKGDPDELGRQIQSLVQSAIDPSPLNVRTETIALDDGYALVVVIPEHRMQPYQNRLNGAFRIRTDKQNAVLPRDQIGSFFKRFEDYRMRLDELIRRQDEALDARDIMVATATRLTISILPREHFDGHEPLRVQDGLRLFTGPVYDQRDDVFTGAPDGYEILTPDMHGRIHHRLYVSNDWFIQASIAHAVYVTSGEGRPTFYELKQRLKPYLEGLVTLLDDNGIRGPFLVEATFTRLKIKPDMGFFFRHDGPARWSSRRLLETLDPEALTSAIHDAARQAARL